VLDTVLRAGEGRLRRRLQATAELVTALEPDYVDRPDAELAAVTTDLRARYADGESLDDLLPEAFAAVREASSRVLGLRHFDEQVMGGAALHLGNVAEMRTGEGKTLVATLPAYLHALTGDAVHIVTVNDYLATRDAAQMGRVHQFLGLTVGVVVADLTLEQRRAAYAADITYGTNNEFGFDYLRDNMATSPSGLVQRGHHFAVVDEVDSILIDEARTPLIISGRAGTEGPWPAEMARLVRSLTIDVHYDVDRKKQTVSLTEAGVAATENQLGGGTLYSLANTALVGQLNNALKAKELYLRDKAYIVVDDEIVLVDEHTGRLMRGRRFSDGLHQALEAKEGVTVQEESTTLASVTLQNYFRMYRTLSGMTGTAATEAAELSRIYGLGVVPIPTHRPVIREDLPDIIFRTKAAKWAAVVADITATHETGQPVLVGTTSVEASEELAGLLAAAGVEHRVLNAKQNESEAHTIAQAGRLGAVTVATNMAGRGTDIVLGGNPEEIARVELEELLARQLELADAGPPALTANANPAAAETRSAGPDPDGALPSGLTPEVLDPDVVGVDVVGVDLVDVDVAETAVVDIRSDDGQTGDVAAGDVVSSVETPGPAGPDPVGPDLDAALAAAETIEAEHGALVRARALASSQQERAAVVAAGGLYVIGTERHESRRIDNQLRGRAGRQGDPGRTRFYASMEDEVLKRFAGPMVNRAMNLLGPVDVPLTSNLMSRSIVTAQTQMESYNADQRREVLKYDDVVNVQRHSLYAERRRVLLGEDLDDIIPVMIDAAAAAVVHPVTAAGYPEQWDLTHLVARMREFAPDMPELPEVTEAEHPDRFAEQLLKSFTDHLSAAYDRRTQELGQTVMAAFTRRVLLAVVDARWKAHLIEIDHLRDGVHLRSYAQKNPVVEFQRDAASLFEAMVTQVQVEAVGYLLNVNPETVSVDG
jgi:preprotein translocase subunit SecA